MKDELENGVELPEGFGNDEISRAMRDAEYCIKCEGLKEALKELLEAAKAIIETAIYPIHEGHKLDQAVAKAEKIGRK